MKFSATIFLFIGLASYANGLNCFTCSVNRAEYNGNPDENCYHPVTTGSGTTSTLCPGAATDSIAYCLTKFVMEDGVVVQADRSCEETVGDHDDNAPNTAAPGDRCTTEEDSSTELTAKTECFFSCSTDNCNTVSAVNVKKCSSDCNSVASKGKCNYITGTCVCENAYTGEDCGNDVTTTQSASRQCLQCNSETDPDCASAASVDCRKMEEYCSTAITTIYDSSATVLKTVTVRGCTSARRVVDQCFFTNIFTDPPISDAGYKEVTCASTCDTNGCNTNTANGVIDGAEAKRLYCVQCTHDTANDLYTAGCANQASNTRTLCPSGSTHCKATTVYLMSNKTDLLHVSEGDDKSWKLLSLVRECATASVTAQCTEAPLGTVDGVKIYNCTETCEEDGCNDGWPARPKCIQCLPSASGCIDSPGEAGKCPHPYDAYCAIEQTGMKRGTGDGIAGYPRKITRACSAYDIGTGCSTMTPRDREVDNCNFTCTTDGCNVGFAGSGSSTPLQSMLAVVTPVVLGWFAHSHL